MEYYAMNTKNLYFCTDLKIGIIFFYFEIAIKVFLKGKKSSKVFERDVLIRYKISQNVWSWESNEISVTVVEKFTEISLEFTKGF